MTARSTAGVQDGGERIRKMKEKEKGKKGADRNRSCEVSARVGTLARFITIRSNQAWLDIERSGLTSLPIPKTSGAWIVAVLSSKVQHRSPLRIVSEAVSSTGCLVTRCVDVFVDNDR
ncbi:uncharacterized protein LOC143423634 [Xylocopa sonorina]|uniref:uncharacterized protein LOC143423634 n=1 Tax=Xylocopa sonorina TaxID=1818115 RepID=UPI00403AAD74